MRRLTRSALLCEALASARVARGEGITIGEPTIGRDVRGGVGLMRGVKPALGLLAVARAIWLAGAAPAHATVAVPVGIDSFGNRKLPAGPLTRTVTPLPLPGTSMTPQAMFSQSDGVGP